MGRSSQETRQRLTGTKVREARLVVRRHELAEIYYHGIEGDLLRCTISELERHTSEKKI